MIEMKPAFAIYSNDFAKKQNKANQSILKLAAKRHAEYKATWKMSHE